MTNSRMSKKTQKLIANSLLCRLHADLDMASEGERAVTPLKDICHAVTQCRIDSRTLAGAYFVQLHMHDSSSLKDEFDKALHDHLGDDFAMGFLIELGRFENAFNAVWEPA